MAQNGPQDRIIRSRAPVRVCDIGGWTDTWFCRCGAVCSMAVDLYTHVRLVRTNTPDIRIISEDLDMSAEIRDFRKIEYDGNLDLLKAAVKRMELQAGARIHVRADSPPGCGTGTSASVAVATLGALAHAAQRDMAPGYIARMAHTLETEELRLESGVQDQYAAALGGVCFMEIDYPEVALQQLDIPPPTVCEIEERLFVVYLGTRRSSDMHLRVVDRYRSGDRDVLHAFEALEAAARDMKQALESGDLDAAADVMNRNWTAQQRLHPHMSTPVVERAQDVAVRHGAAGFKVNGAGGGGSAAILARPGREHDLRRALLEHDIPILPCKLNFKGLQTWEA